MRKGEGFAHGRGDLNGTQRLDAAFAFDELRDIGAFDELHDEIKQAAGRLPGVMNSDDIGVAKLRHGLRLMLEAGGELRISVLDLRGQHLDGNRAAQIFLGAFVNRTHPPTCDQGADFVLRQQHLQIRYTEGTPARFQRGAQHVCDTRISQRIAARLARIRLQHGWCHFVLSHAQ